MIYQYCSLYLTHAAHRCTSTSTYYMCTLLIVFLIPSLPLSSSLASSFPPSLSLSLSLSLSPSLPFSPTVSTLLAMSEYYLTQQTPKGIKEAVRCLMAALSLKPPPRIEARTRLKLGLLFYHHTNNLHEARVQLDQAVSACIHCCVVLCVPVSIISVHNLTHMHCTLFHYGERG